MIKDTRCHADIGNQIDNSWNKDSALAIKKENIGISIKMREFHKKTIRNKFLSDSTVKNYGVLKRRVTVITHGYLLHRLLIELDEMFDEIIVCGDVGNFSYLNKYYSKICKLLKNRPSCKLKPRKGKGHSKAHRWANDVYKGRKSPDFLIKNRDIKELINIINKLLHK